MSRSVFFLNWRQFLRGSGIFAFAGFGGCTFDRLFPEIDTTATSSIVRPDSLAIRPQISVDSAVTNPDIMYAGIHEGQFQLSAIPYKKIPRRFRRQIVPDTTGEAPGTIVVHVREHFLYFVQAGGIPFAMVLVLARRGLNGQSAPMCSINGNGHAGHLLRK